MPPILSEFFLGLLVPSIQNSEWFLGVSFNIWVPVLAICCSRSGASIVILDAALIFRLPYTCFSTYFYFYFLGKIVRFPLEVRGCINSGDCSEFGECNEYVDAITIN